MKLKPLHNPSQGTLKVAALMSGSGSNLRKILEKQEELKNKKGGVVYKVMVIFSDTFDSKACEIGKDFDIPVVTRDLRGFYVHRGKPRSDLRVREEFDRETIRALAPFEAKVAAYAGYMNIATKPLVEAYLGVNVHPADLSIEVEGKRKYVGAHVVRDAILAGEPSIRSTTHIIEPLVDGGRLLMISSPLPVVLENSFNSNNTDVVRSVADFHQENLKKVGDWVIFPKTLQYIAEGRYAQDDEGKLFFDDQPIPKGLKLNRINRI